MALSPKLELRQSQALVMTPQLQQAIKLLQLSSLDLTAYVEVELERNPLLERAEDDDGPIGVEAARAEDSSGEAGADAPSGDDRQGDDWQGDDWSGETAAGETWSDLARETDPGEVAAHLDTDVENVFPDDARAGGATAAEPMMAESGWSMLGTGRGGSFDGDAFDFESVLTGERTLHDHLNEQLALSTGDPARRLIGAHLIDMVDEAGYLRGDLDALAQQLGAAPALVEEMLHLMQEFDPPGIMARNLAECLKIQLKDKDRLDPCMLALIDNIELLARREFEAIKRICKVDDEDLTEMIGEIRALDPKPGLKFTANPIEPVVPDIFVRPKADGSWHIELNSDALPKVLVNQSYYASVAAGARSAADKSYLAECLQNASWLVKSLDQRARTILKVASEIVRQQDAFLIHGIHHLRPLNLKTVADAIAMHESTVSRVTANKYMATPRGTFELKFFFTAAIASADGGEAHSAEAVRHKIREMIEQEKTNAVLSDDQIVQILNEQGIDIARRTVAKYREAMNIASSVQRRREKKMMA